MMKFVILVALVSTVYGLRIQKRQVQPTIKPIAILRLESDIAPDGSSYHYAYETENGISAEESGQLKGSGEEAGTSAQGNYKFTSPEGVPVQIEYVADENGFQPVGNVIPTPPPIPDAIVRALQYNEAHPGQDDLSSAPQPSSVYNPIGKYTLG